MIVAEIEPLVPRFVAPFFADYNERVTEQSQDARSNSTTRGIS